MKNVTIDSGAGRNVWPKGKKVPGKLMPLKKKVKIVAGTPWTLCSSPGRRRGTPAAMEHICAPVAGILSRIPETGTRLSSLGSVLGTIDTRLSCLEQKIEKTGATVLAPESGTQAAARAASHSGSGLLLGTIGTSAVEKQFQPLGCPDEEKNVRQKADSSVSVILVKLPVPRTLLPFSSRLKNGSDVPHT